MSHPRRFLPPTGWLSAFEAVARRGSVTEAASELNLTQGAVSRQIQKLEEQLEQKLFLRDRKRLSLTPAGETYAAEIREALTRIGNATVALRSNPDGGTLDLAILPAFGTHWLAPRLQAFLSTHPGVTVNLSTRIVPFDFTQEKFHAAIHYGRDNWPGTTALKLMEEELVPVLSPALTQGARPDAGGIATLPLLQLETRSRIWSNWFEARGITYEGAPGMGFDQFATMHQAAVSGLGVAMLPRFMVEADLASGKLVTVEGGAIDGPGAYYLVWPETRADYPPLRVFREWLKESAP
jgi:DNA-binding transcriptional LysR family regulator